MMIVSHINTIKNQYNPEHDLPDGPWVTATDYRLLVCVEELLERIEKLENAVATIAHKAIEAKEE